MWQVRAGGSGRMDAFKQAQRSTQEETLETATSLTQTAPAEARGSSARHEATLGMAQGEPSGKDAELGHAALKLVEEGNIQEACAVVEGAIALGESADLWNTYATIHYVSGEVKKAEDAYQRCLQLDPGHRQASVNLGILLLAEGRAGEAASHLGRYALSEGENVTVKRLQIECEQKQKAEKLEAAIEYLLVRTLNEHASRATGEASNRALTAQFMKLLVALEPSCFLDIGANDGTAARAVKKIRPDCEVWAFEANPQIHEKYAPLLATSGAYYVNLAVAEKTGQIKVYAPRTLSQAVVAGQIVERSAIEPLDTGKTSMYRRTENSTYQEFDVDAVRLDDFVALRKIPLDGRKVALWIDVEGAAFEVLSGAKVALSAVSIIMIESENHEFWVGQKQCANIARLIIAAGFVPIQRDREYGDKQFNTIFLHHSFLGLLYSDTYRLEAVATGFEDKQAPTGGLTSLVSNNPERVHIRYRSIAAQAASEMPVFVPVFDNPTYAGMMLRQLRKLGLQKIYLVDNGSTYPPMLRFLEQAERDANVIRNEFNAGPREAVLSAVSSDCIPDIFCVTDPDLEFNAQLPEDFLAQLALLTRTYKLGKAGFALRLDDAHLMHQKKFTIIGKEWHVQEWEEQFWKEPMDVLLDGSPVYRAIIDTTFAVYNKRHFTPNSFYLAARVAGDYTCRHLPWYRASGIPWEEENFYRKSQKYSLHMGGVADTTASGVVKNA